MNHTASHSFKNEICFSQVVDPTHLWGNNIPALELPLPKLVLQMTLALFVNHGLVLASQYVRQPRIVADILTALVLSPSMLNHIHHKLDEIVFPKQSLTNLETMANLGLIYTMFIQGLHLDLTPNTAKKTTKMLALSWSLIILPFAIGCALYLVFWVSIENERLHSADVVAVYWGTIIATTTSQTLAPVLANLKLLCTDLGREALSIGMLNGIFSWLLMMFFTISISATSPNPDNNHHASHILSLTTGSVYLFMVLYMVLCFLVIRPAITKLVGDTSEGETYSDSTVEGILIFVLACGFFTDFIGSHFAFGAFVLGMSIPNGVLASTLIAKMEDCVLGILMPLYFAVIGTRLDIGIVFQEFKYIWVILIAVLAKPLCTIANSVVFNIPILDGLALGVLLSAKGLLPLVIIHIGYERGHLSEHSFTLLLLIILVSSIMIQPIIGIGYKKIRKSNQPYKQRTLEGVNPIDELRIMTCIHSPQNVSSIINLLEITNITTQTPVSVSVVHLVEQVGQAAAMLIEHASRNPSSSLGDGAKNIFHRMRCHSEHITSAFHDYEAQHSPTENFVQSLTIVSPIDTMHEDICNLAENKQAALIILPFHKQQGLDGNLEDTNIEFRAVNQSVMAMSPCSVGLLVDRGLRVCLSTMSTSTPRVTSRNGRNQKDTQIAMVYVGGPDDREALTYAWRMAGHPFVTLTVIRFVVGDNPIDVHTMKYLEMDASGKAADNLTILTENDKERQIDEEFLHTFKQNTAYDESICYVEKVSNNGEETVNSLRELHRDYDLYIVGRARSVLSPLTAGLAEWSDCPELGPIGDVLVTSDFATNSSVLVIQQHSGGYKYDNDYDRYSEDQVLMGSGLNVEQPHGLGVV